MSAVYLNEQVETVSLTGPQLTSGMFDVVVTLKSGAQSTVQMSGGDILVKYGGYLTAADRRLISTVQSQTPVHIPGKHHKKDGHHHHHHWRCSIM